MGSEREVKRAIIPVDNGVAIIFSPTGDDPAAVNMEVLVGKDCPHDSPAYLMAQGVVATLKGMETDNANEVQDQVS